MKVLDLQENNGTVTVTIYIEPDEFSAALDEAYAQDPERYPLPDRESAGLRKRLEKLYGEQVLYNEALDIAFSSALIDIMGERGITPAAPPEVGDVTFPAGGGAQAAISVDVFPEMTMGEYKGLAAKDEGDEAAFAQAVMHKAVERLEVELPASIIDGKLENIIAQEKAIVSQDPIYSMLSDVLYMLEKVYRLLGVVRPQPDLRSEAMDIMLKTVSPEQDEPTKEHFFAQIAETAAKQSKLPDDFSRKLDTIMEKRRKHKEGMTSEQKLDDIFDAYMGSLQISPEQWREQRRELAAEQIKHDLVLDEVARRENIQATQREVDAAYAEIAKQYNMPLDDVKASLPDASVGWQLCREKAQRLIIDSAIRL